MDGDKQRESDAGRTGKSRTVKEDIERVYRLQDHRQDGQDEERKQPRGKSQRRLRLTSSKFTALASLGAFATTTLALNPIEVHEQQFIDSKTGDRFMVLGVDYQPGGQGSYGTGSGDPLSDPEACLRDAALMQNLGVNTIRSYNLDPTLNHDQCVSIFNQAGIYMILDVNSPLPGESINRADPSSTYTSTYLQRAFSVIEAFKGYPNTLGFFGVGWTVAIRFTLMTD